MVPHLPASLVATMSTGVPLGTTSPARTFCRQWPSRSAPSSSPPASTGWLITALISESGGTTPKIRESTSKRDADRTESPIASAAGLGCQKARGCTPSSPDTSDADGAKANVSVPGALASVGDAKKRSISAASAAAASNSASDNSTAGASAAASEQMAS